MDIYGLAPILAQVNVPSGANGNQQVGDRAAEFEPPPRDVNEAVATVRESLAELWVDFLRRLPLLVAGLILLGITWIAARIGAHIAHRVAERMRLRASLQELFGQFAYIGIWFIGIIVAAVVVFPGMTPARMLTVLGLGSIAIGFAFKDIVENFFAGILILWRFPFEPGDYIQCGDVEGKVENTTIRMTTVRQVDGQLVVMPNAQLFKMPVRVLTSRPVRRISVITGVAYGEDLDRAREVIAESVGKCSSVRRDEPIEIFAREFSDSSINFEVAWWTGSTLLDERRSRDEVVAAVKRGLNEAGIEIPFPYRTLTFKGELPIKRSEDD
jgi:small conductance mechanosensitive channel